MPKSSGSQPGYTNTTHRKLYLFRFHLILSKEKGAKVTQNGEKNWQSKKCFKNLKKCKNKNKTTKKRTKQQSAKKCQKLYKKALNRDKKVVKQIGFRKSVG